MVLSSKEPKFQMVNVNSADKILCILVFIGKLVYKMLNWWEQYDKPSNDLKDLAGFYKYEVLGQHMGASIATGSLLA